MEEMLKRLKQKKRCFFTILLDGLRQEERFQLNDIMKYFLNEYDDVEKMIIKIDKSIERMKRPTLGC